MATRIRMRRMGAKKSPFYRIAVVDSHSPRDGKFIEEIGFYNPKSQPAEIRLEKEKALEWLKKGAQPSPTVKTILKSEGVWQQYTALKSNEQ